ncbi:MAG: hypothetical protein R6V58_17580 [Planctomycetota bacterium]
MNSHERKIVSLGKLVFMGLILLLVAFGLATLMPTLKSAKFAAVRSSLEQKMEPYRDAAAPAIAPGKEKPAPPKALVKSFDAEIELTPKLSVGTARPESIYVAEFDSVIEARSPNARSQVCEIDLPLPPQLISLADVQVTLNGEPVEDFRLSDNKLVLRPALAEAGVSKITVCYSATGKGIYTLEKPSGKIIDLFRTQLIANRSDIRMLQLSLQPNSFERAGGKTAYTWEYKRLVVARPIAIDVLGIAAIDRLGELTWLGPLSVLIFGVLIGVATLAVDPTKLNAWLLVLVAGCFAGAYPLMYFMQDFVPLSAAVVMSGVVVLGVVAWRIMSLFGWRQGLFAGLLLPGVIMALTVSASVYTKPAIQGLILTVTCIVSFVVALIMLPEAQANVKLEVPAAMSAGRAPTRTKPEQGQEEEGEKRET